MMGILRPFFYVTMYIHLESSTLLINAYMLRILIASCHKSCPLHQNSNLLDGEVAFFKKKKTLELGCASTFSSGDSIGIVNVFWKSVLDQ